MVPASETNSVILYDNKEKCWLSLRRPLKVYTTTNPDLILPLLTGMENDLKEHPLYAAGFIAYEAASAFDPSLRVKSTDAFPLLWFGLYQEAEPFSFPEHIDTSELNLSWQASIPEMEYQACIKKIKQYIRAGDTYQVNYSFRLTTPFEQDPWQLFVQMIHAQEYGYGAFINIDNWCICSASHELFFKHENDILVSRPMKGTVSRGLDSEADLNQAGWLSRSQKNKAENLMIVDMVRNDMGHIADTGSVETIKLFEIEKYPTLWQMTSTVRGKSNTGIAEIFSALFPAASITGAPKTRTMEIIAELESSPRRIYTGSIGLITPEYRAQFNVAIRTVLFDKQNKQAEYGVGGGIVWDSEPESEYQECRTKAKVLTHRFPEFSLLETLLWTPETALSFLDEHMQRLSNSADYFSWRIDMEAIRNQLQQRVQGLPAVPHKIRLLVAKTGDPTIEAQVIDNEQRNYRIHLADKPVNANDVFLYHKTTHRQIYEQAMAAGPDYDDALLWNENDEVTESCIANIVVEIDNQLCTPPITCGLLPGIYRSHLLKQGSIRERVIKVKELSQCSRIYLVNSVRGMWQVSLNK